MTIQFCAQSVKWSHVKNHLVKYSKLNKALDDVDACMQTANIHKWEIWKFIEVLRLNKTDRQMQCGSGKQKHQFGLNALDSNERERWYYMRCGDMRMKSFSVSLLKYFENCLKIIGSIASGEFTGWINNATLHITFRARELESEKPMNKLKTFLRSE